ncbi:MAG: isoprenylcysteine carboxylmethyltransferase family protein [Ignavibacteriae bacterium]|nr:isoprenylcysteine carboxylmethyltransferase family protein [Ignavibacteriota bacterium]
MMDPLGKSPIPLPLLIIGKTAMIASWLLLFLKSWVSGGILYDSAVTRAAGIFLFTLGSAMAILSIVNLGRSISVGIPQQQTELKTHGLYRISRNPIYLGAFLMCAGSCLYTLHIVNIIFFAITVLEHHAIIKKEELFLEERFGDRWREYKARVPRYVGSF